MRVVQRSVNLSSTRNLQQILIVPSLNDKTDTLEVVILLAEDVAGSLWIILLSLSTSLSSSTSNLESPTAAEVQQQLSLGDANKVIRTSLQVLMRDL